MNNFFAVIRECARRMWEKKITLIVFGVIFLLFTVLGLCFIKTPSIYYYHLSLCDQYVDRVCYSDTNVFVIFLERSAGHLVLIVVSLAAGIHWCAIVVPSLLFAYRAYTFGGSLYVFFSVYKMSGALIVFVLYLPVHLLIDLVFVAAIAVSCGRAPRFRFQKCDFTEILCDFAVFAVLIVFICLLEMLLLAAVFHPIGYII